MIPSWMKQAAFSLCSAAIIGGLLYGRAYYIAAGEANVRAQWKQADDNRMREDAEAARRRETTERTKEQARQQEADRIAHEQANKEREQQARDQRAAATTRSLHATIDELNRQLVGVSGAGADAARFVLADGTRVARELLGSCAERYRAMAADADGLRDQVDGLQSFVIHACNAGPANPQQQTGGADAARP
ncbi:DUF2514 family protein [Burkholderia anthina]|uniref:DUF2514 family protein n=1 Tax=Burkholderia anthina TaxID=179879 RepID=UPI00158C83EE|nr:DUF2514 family protein [Burkholderia anthina]